MKRFFVVSMLVLGLTAGLTACGSKSSSGSSKSSTGPKFALASGGTYAARVESARAAQDLCTNNQADIESQLKGLGVKSGTGEVVALEYGTGVPQMPTALYALTAGQSSVVSTNLTLCGVIVK
jgi:hypothetical protein